MPWYKRAWSWIKDHTWGILAAFGGVFLALLAWKAASNKIGSLNDAVQVRAAIREIAAKSARADALEEQADAKGEDVTALRREIAASKRRVMEIHDATPLDDLDDSEVAALFSASGF